MGSNIKTVETEAFSGCGIKEISIPTTVASIKGNAFASCLNLTTLSYPNQKIDYAATMFSGCTNLVTLIITGEGDMQDYTATTQQWNPVKTSITTVTLSEKITSIRAFAFYGMTKLTKITLNED